MQKLLSLTLILASLFLILPRLKAQETEVVSVENEVVTVETETVSVENEVVVTEETEVVVNEEATVAGNVPPTPLPYPITALNTYAIEPYWYANDPNNQVVNHHFCNVHQPTGVVQCALFDSRDPANARLVGIEYGVSADVFNTFDNDEKKLWHSHAYPVQSGNLIAPDLNGTDRTNFLDGVANSYGKAIFFWNTPTNPIGLPIPVYSFIADGQIAPGTIEVENNQTLTSPQERVGENSDVTIPPVAGGADQWAQSGKTELFDTSDFDLPDNLWGLNFS